MSVFIGLADCATLIPQAMGFRSGKHRAHTKPLSVSQVPWTMLPTRHCPLSPRTGAKPFFTRLHQIGRLALEVALQSPSGRRGGNSLGKFAEFSTPLRYLVPEIKYTLYFRLHPLLFLVNYLWPSNAYFFQQPKSFSSVMVQMIS